MHINELLPALPGRPLALDLKAEVLSMLISQSTLTRLEFYTRSRSVYDDNVKTDLSLMQ